MADDPFGIRPGEVAIPLPTETDASVYFIGRIRTPWTRREDCPKNARESDAVCRIEIDNRWAQALKDVETCSHLVVLYWMDKARRDLVVQAPRIMASNAAPLRCARRRGQIQSP
jgi:tRNA (Thr-GGU) A37 N-methylase